jgi:hypothetical protein
MSQNGIARRKNGDLERVQSREGMRRFNEGHGIERKRRKGEQMVDLGGNLVYFIARLTGELTKRHARCF